jgi:hypothetical protein
VAQRENIIHIRPMHPYALDGMSEYGDLSPAAIIRLRPVTESAG